MKNFGDCEEVKEAKKIVITDQKSKNKRSKFCLENPKQKEIRVITVDDCVIKEGIRCDYLIILPDAKEIYVELKGKDVKHAVQQIEASIKQLTSNSSAEKLCFIVSTRCPIISPQIQVIKKTFFKKYQAKLFIKNGKTTHKV